MQIILCSQIVNVNNISERDGGKLVSEGHDNFGLERSPSLCVQMCVFRCVCVCTDVM